MKLAKEFKPRKGQKYYMINSRFNVRVTEHTGSHKSKERIASGNAFRTHSEAEEFLKHLRKGLPISRLDHLKAALFGK